MTALRHTILVMGFLASVFGAYVISNLSKDATDRITELQHEIREEERRIAALRADWAYLNRGDRLEDLVAHHHDQLQLGPTSPVQLAPLSFRPEFSDRD